MTTITFDTLQLVDKLKSAGIPQEQAEAVVHTIAEAQTQLVTRTDLEMALTPLKTDLAILKWMMGVMLAGVVSLVLKVFF